MKDFICQHKLIYPEILWQRPVHYYKPSAGRVLVVGGSRGLISRLLFTCESVFKSGTGMITIAFPEEFFKKLQIVLGNDLLLPLPQTPSGSLSKRAEKLILEQSKDSDIIIIGPGTSTNLETVAIIWDILQKLDKPVVICEDAIASLIYGIKVLWKKGGEESVINNFKRFSFKNFLIVNNNDLLKISAIIPKWKKIIPKITSENKKINFIEQLSDLLKCNIIFQSQNLIIANSKQIIITPLNIERKFNQERSINILAGIIGSFLAQNPHKQKEALATAVYIYSLSLKKTIQSLNQNKIKEKDIINAINLSIKKLEKENM